MHVDDASLQGRHVDDDGVHERLIPAQVFRKEYRTIETQAFPESQDRSLDAFISQLFAQRT